MVRYMITNYRTMLYMQIYTFMNKKKKKKIEPIEIYR